MSINPALVNGPYGLVPAPYQGEFIFAGRGQMCLQLEGVRTPNTKYSANGSIFLSNLRVVFVACKMDPSGIAAVELPLTFISGEKVSQPIFGCNNLTGKCALVDESGGNLNFKILFSTGGMGTFVPLFYSALEFVRVSGRQQCQQEIEGQTPTPNSKGGMQKPPSFVNAACVDPNDPTTVYLTQQPVDEKDRLATGPLYPVV